MTVKTKNQTFIYFHSLSEEDCKRPVSRKRYPNLFSMPQREMILAEIKPLSVFFSYLFRDGCSGNTNAHSSKMVIHMFKETLRIE